jgi:simple sugar transport system ATP-binding protein
VDVGAQASIWDLMRQARSKGLAVLLISADLEELIGLSDTIRVILRGGLSGEFDPDTVTSEDLGAAMTGAVGRAHTEPASGHEPADQGQRPHPTTDDGGDR